MRVRFDDAGEGVPSMRVRVDVEGRPVAIDIFNERKLQIPKVGELFEVNFDADACWLI